MNEDEASIRIGGLSVWVEGYQFVDATDYWDANWVHIRAECLGQNAVVRLSDPCLRLPELADWAKACQRLLNGQASTAQLSPMEPYLQITIDRSVEFTGLMATVKLTPDNVTQFHEFRFPIDQSDVARVIQSTAAVLSRLPIREP